MEVIRFFELLTEASLLVKLRFQCASSVFNLFSSQELCSDFSLGSDWALHPRVCDQITQCHAHVWLIVQHAVDKALKILAVESFRFGLLVCFPKFVLFVLCNQTIEWVLCTGLISKRGAFTYEHE